MSLPVMLGVGLMLGARHAVDADHLVAVAGMLGREGGISSALRTAALWSIGHSFTFLGVGLGIVALELRVPASFERAAELAVAVMLVVLGVFNWKNAHEQPNEPSRPTVRPIAAGIIHGLAGSAGIALLALTTIQTAWGAILYLLAFGVGTVVGMVVSTALLSVPLGLSHRASREHQHTVTKLASVASVCLGVFLAWRSGNSLGP